MKNNRQLSALNSRLILCVEDEVRVLRNNEKKLTEAGFNVLAAQNLTQARECLARHTPDGIVLDIMLPDGNGLEFLKELRARNNSIPVLMLTAWNTDADIARGLDLGADDYIGKPFAYEVLLSRIRKMLAKAERVPERVTHGALSFDILGGKAFINGEDLLLRPKEYALLLLFVQNSGKIMKAEELYKKVWNAPLAGDKNTLQATISALRQKIGPCGYDIHLLRGKGYCFE